MEGSCRLESLKLRVAVCRNSLLRVSIDNLARFRMGFTAQIDDEGLLSTPWCPTGAGDTQDRDSGALGPVAQYVGDVVPVGLDPIHPTLSEASPEDEVPLGSQAVLGQDRRQVGDER